MRLSQQKPFLTSTESARSMYEDDLKQLAHVQPGRRVVAPKLASKTRVLHILKRHGLKSRMTLVKPPLSKKNIIKRMNFALEHKAFNWNQVNFVCSWLFFTFILFVGHLHR